MGSSCATLVVDFNGETSGVETVHLDPFAVYRLRHVRGCSVVRHAIGRNRDTDRLPL